MPGNGIPNFRRPVLVEHVRIVQEEHIVRIEGEVASLLRAQRKGKMLAILGVDGHDLLLTWSFGSPVVHHAGDLEFFERRQQARLVSEISMFGIRIKWIVKS